MATKDYLINGEIQAKNIRIKTEEGSILMTREEAFQKAREEEKDLIQISSDGETAICRMIEEDKFKYELQRKEKIKNKKQPEQKRMGFSLNIQENDIETKKKAVIRFLQGGHRVRISVRLHRKQMQGDFATKAKLHIMNIVDGISKNVKLKIEAEPTFEGKEAHVILIPLKQ